MSNNNNNSNKTIIDLSQDSDDDVIVSYDNKKRKSYVSLNDPVEFTFVTINIDELEFNKIENTINAITASLNDPNNKPDIIFIQETKLEDNKDVLLELKKELKDYEYEMYHNSIYSNCIEFKHGTCVLVRRNSQLMEGAHFETTFDWDVEGRVVVWKSKYGTFVGVYAATPNLKPKDVRIYSNTDLEIPKRYIHREEFDKKLKSYLKSEQHKGHTIIIMGDWNCCLDVMDTSKGILWESAKYKKCQARHNELKDELKLIDIWRYRNPKDQNRYSSRVTHLKGKKPSLVRIDMILIPKSLNDNVIYIDIMDNGNFLTGDRGDVSKQFKHKLNHLPIVMKIRLSPTEINDSRQFKLSRI